MNIFLLFPLADMETGIAIKDAFESLGHKVCAVDANTTPHLAHSIFASYGADFDLLLCSRTPDLYEEVIKIKKQFPKITTACWNTDVRIPFETWGQLLFLFEYVDYYFDVSEGMLDEAKKWNKNSFYLPQGLHDRRYYPAKPTQNQLDDWSCDVGFIGNVVPNIHTERAELLESFKEKLNFRHFTGIYGELHNYAVGCCFVNLCGSINDLKNSFSVRTWKIIGAEGLALDYYHEGCEETFYGAVETYRCIDEAVDKAKYMIANYDTYKKKVKKARNQILRNDCYKHRIKKMLKIIFG